MSFSTAPKSGPTILTPNGVKATSPNVPSPSQPQASPSKAASLSARERAIAAMRGELKSKVPDSSPAQQIAAEKEESKPTFSTEVAEKIKESAPSTEESESKFSKDTTIESSSEKTETSTEATKTKEEPLSTQYAILARKEKALRAKALQQEQAIKAREQALAEKEAAIKAKEAEYGSKFIPKDKLMEDPLSALSELGLSYDTLTQAALSSPDPQYQQLQMKIKALEDAQERAQKALEDQRKAVEEQQQKSFEQAKRQVRNEVTDLIDSNPEFETVKATDSVDDVVDLIVRTYNEEGKLLTAEQAAREVENFLAEEAYKLAQLKKIQSRFKSETSAQPKQAVAETPKEQSTTGMKTLTNAVSSSRQLSARERAMLAFKGQLKS